MKTTIEINEDLSIDIELETLFEQVEIREIVEAIGAGPLLEEIGVDAVRAYIGREGD